MKVLLVETEQKIAGFVSAGFKVQGVVVGKCDNGVKR